MPIYNKDSRLAEPILYDPGVIQVIRRFGFSIGVGEVTIRDACKSHGIDVGFFLSVVNTFLNSRYYPEKAASESEIPILLDYLAKTDRYYLEVLLPNIDRHFGLLASRRPNDSGVEGESNLGMLMNFYKEVRHDMTSFIEYDLNIWIPARRELSKTEGEGLHDSSLIEEKLEDMMRLFVMHLHGPNDPNLCVAVLSALHSLAKDVRQNNRIRTRLLARV